MKQRNYPLVHRLSLLFLRLFGPLGRFPIVASALHGLLNQVSTLLRLSQTHRRELMKGALWSLSIAFLAICGGITTARFILWRGARIDDLKVLESHKPIQITKVLDRNGKIIDIISSEKRIVLEYSNIPSDFVHAMVALEDATFFDHIGVDPVGILAAAKDYALTFRKRGASTLTQQLVKNITKDKRRSFGRKLKEQFLAIQVEARFTKEEIFAMYANEVPFGNNQYGIQAAADFYFGSQVGTLSLEQCATLAGIPQAPSRLNPYRNHEACLNKRNLVLDRMYEEGYISRERRDKAKKEPLVVIARGAEISTTVAGHFVDKVREQLFSSYGEDLVRTAGWDVTTTLDMDYQNAAERALREGLKQVDKSLGYRPRDCANIYKGSAIQDPTLLETFEHSTWTQIFQAGIQLRGVVTKVEQERIAVRIGQNRFWLDAQNMPWLKIGERGMKGLFKVGDIPLFKLIPVAEAETTTAVEQEVPAAESEEGEEGEEAALDAGPDRRRIADGAILQGLTLELDQEPEIEGALLAVDVHSGDMLAMVGAYDYGRSKFNRSEQALRQVGSAIKPIIFGAAFEKGKTLADRVFDGPTVFLDPSIFGLSENGQPQLHNSALRFTNREIAKPYEPLNYDRKYEGWVTLRMALAESRNIPSVKLLNEVGYDQVIDYAQRMQMETERLLPYPSMALGSMEGTLRDLVYAYATFASGGVRYEPRFMSQISDSKGRMIEQTSARGAQVISPQNAFLVTQGMKAVIVERTGTGHAAARLGIPMAGKTGTTDDYTDAWFIGYTPDLAVGVWVGRDLKKPIGRNRTGGSTALPIYVHFMEQLSEKLKKKDFEMVEGLSRAPIDKQTGTKLTRDCGCEVRGDFQEYFITGTEPVEICTRAEQERLKQHWLYQEKGYGQKDGKIKPLVVWVDLQSQKRGFDLIRLVEGKPRAFLENSPEPTPEPEEAEPASLTPEAEQ